MEMNYDRIRIAQLAANYRRGANWFYWIAALSMITSLITFGGGGVRFIFSLGITQIIDGFGIGVSQALDGGNGARIVALLLDLVITGIFVLFGYLSNQKQIWAYLIGAIVFLMDGLLCLLFGEIVSVLAHGFVLFF